VSASGQTCAITDGIEQKVGCDDPRPPSAMSRYRPQVGPMTGREPNERKRNWQNDWPILGFLDRTLDDERRFERFKELCRLLLPLAMLVIVLIVVCVLVGVLALAHVDVIGGYYHLTPHADEWQRWGIPSGGISAALIGIKASRKYRSHRAASLKRKATAGAVETNEETKKSLPRRGKAPKPGLD
jgi:hypothetical protein